MDDVLPWYLLHDNPEQLYTEGSYIVLDFETDNTQNGSALHDGNDIVLACWTMVWDGKVRQRASCFGGIYEQQELLDVIAEVDFIVAQNLKFELQWLKRCGLDLRTVHGYDTMLAEWVLDGNRLNPRSLSALAAKYGVPGKEDLVSSLIKQGVPTRDIHPAWLEEYCDADVEATRQVFLKQQERLTQAKQWHLVHTRNLTCSVLADIEFEGLYLDPERVKAEYIKAAGIKEDLGSQLATMTRGINLDSPKQLTHYLYDVLGLKEVKDYRGNFIRTPSGAPSADSKVLARLKPETDEQREFLKLYKKYNKQASLLEKNLEYFKLTCEQREGKFQGEFKQGRVQTHRLASSGIPILFDGLKKTKSVQMQNIPQEYKKLFWSGHEEYQVLEADSSQLEFRVAVELGQDKVGLAEIESGVDIHTNTAKVITEAGQATTRFEAKAISFAPLYGGRGRTGPEQAYAAYFKEHYAGISKTQRTWALQAVDRKQITTPYGLTFYFPGTKMKESGYITNTTIIYNYPIQGFATGEIIPISLVYFWHRTKNIRASIFSTVHDSFAARVHKDDIPAAKEAAKQALTLDVYDFLERVYHYKMRVPLGLGTKASRNWGEGEEEKIDVWASGREEVR